MVILGINAYHADASAALVVDGQLVAAAEEERFNRIKHSAGVPAQAIKACLKLGGLEARDIDHVAVARDPTARLAKKALYAIRVPKLALDRLAAWKTFGNIPSALASCLERSSLPARYHRVEHHKAHLASSFFVSPFENAALLSADGLGDFASTMWGVGRESKLSVLGATAFPHSLGIYYTALTQYLGFWKYGDEYKVMGLAACGEPEFKDEFDKIIRLDGRLGFSLGLDYFIHHKNGPEMTWFDGEPLLGRLFSDQLLRRLGPARENRVAVEKRDQNIASSLQSRLEDTMFSLLNKLYELTKLKQLCLAGGVAFNCVVNGKIFEKTPFEKVYIQPAAGDAGLAIGAAFYVWNQILGQPRSFEMKHAYWGPEFSNDNIGKVLGARSRELERTANGELRIAELSEERLVKFTAKKIAEGKVVGWFQGRMEWGPRALGNRSIVVDPRQAEMKEILNARIKHREPFRPFAPSILEERVGDYFEHSYPSPFMLMTYKVKAEKRNVIPAPTHVDGSGRLQTVSKEQNPLYWQLLKVFEKLTGVPVLLNTSFNENEPIVHRPEEALDCFLRTKMEVLVIGRYVVEKVGETSCVFSS
ncbi:MAG: carbamoyltransferase [Candidatus Binatia bacterium]